jgi:hypothetical protein
MLPMRRLRLYLAIKQLQPLVIEGHAGLLEK